MSDYTTQFGGSYAKIAFEEKFDDFDLRTTFGKLTYPAKDRQFKKSGSQGQKREFHSK
ncbi:MAG: hypothetical protein AAF443_05375 [Chlamydiota bacterium]